MRRYGFIACFVGSEIRSKWSANKNTSSKREKTFEMHRERRRLETKDSTSNRGTGVSKKTKVFYPELVRVNNWGIIRLIT